MLNKVKTLAAAAALAIALPAASYAATISGAISIEGDVLLGSSTIADGGYVDLGATGSVQSATGDFSVISADTIVTLSSFAITPGSQLIWSVGGFTFTANSFADFFDNGIVQGFSTTGVISNGNSEDDTDGTLVFSTQGTIGSASFSSTTTAVPVPAAGLLLIAGIGALGVAGRRKKAA